MYSHCCIASRRSTSPSTATSLGSAASSARRSRELAPQEPHERAPSYELDADQHETEDDERRAGDAEKADVREARSGDVDRDASIRAERENGALAEPREREKAREPRARIVRERAA